VASGEHPVSAVLPLVASGDPLGVLRFAFDDGRALESEDRVFLEALAGQCALAVERARLYEREQRTAEALQRNLLPDRLPEVAGLELAARCLPGMDEAEVGGDWYDAFLLPDGRLALVVGDVMGKGVTAAADMGRVRAALRALAFTDPSPAAVLTGLDALFTATEDEEKIVTLIYAVVDPATRTVVVSDAGHPPVLCRPYDGDALLVDAGPETTPLGVPEPRFERRWTLRPGDVVMGFSDGLVETRVRPIGEGMDQLVSYVRNAADRPLAALVDGVVEHMAAGQRRQDDVTILALRIVA
jgi:serine phosphatase RsbU (regulator of sigma subunit)